MVGHVQAQTPVGFQFRITIYAYQLFLGTWFPLFELNPADFPHRHGTTHSKVAYIWYRLQKLGITLIVAEQWLPKQKFDNNVAIMDAVIQTK